MDGVLKIDIEVVGLEEEFDTHVANIKKIIPTALNAVGSEMILNLKKHIQEDFYNEYSPVAYRRRYDENGLLDDNNMDAQTIDKNILYFTYTPKGVPMGKLKDSLNWSEDLENYLKSVNKTGESPFFSSVRNDDDLIRWGQTAHDIGTKHIPARPFWNNFVEEQKNEKIMQTFVNAFAKTPYQIIETGNDLEWGSADGVLDEIFR